MKNLYISMQPDTIETTMKIRETIGVAIVKNVPTALAPCSNTTALSLFA